MTIPLTLHEFSFVDKYREFKILLIFDLQFGQANNSKEFMKFSDFAESFSETCN
jgi:hypothetical protein